MPPAQNNPPNYSRVIGDRVSLRRRELKLSQKELAILYGVSRELVSQIETGRAQVNAGDLPRLANILVVPISYFYGGVEYALDAYDTDALPNISPAARVAIRAALDDAGRGGYALTPDEDELLSYYRGLIGGLKSLVLNTIKRLFEVEQDRASQTEEDQT